MSLIEEALRRIQDPTLNKTQTGQSPASSKPAPADPKAKTEPPAHSWQAPPSAAGMNTLTIVGLSTLAVAVLVVAVSLLWISRSFNSTAATGTRAAAPTRVASRTGVARPAPAAQPQDEYELAAPPPPALPGTVVLTNESLVEAQEPAGFTMPWVKIQPKDKPEPYLLTGIVEGTGEPYAMINDRIVGVGDWVDGATLASIRGGAVTLREKNGQEIVLRIEQP
jgi:hypothetical protein